MSPRTPTVQQALAGAVLHGDISAEAGRAALFTGLPADLPCFDTDAAGIERASTLIAAGKRVLLLGRWSIPGRVGEYWGPHPMDAGRAIRRAECHPKDVRTAFRYGKGVRGNDAVGAVLSVTVEIDGETLPRQAALLDRLDSVHGVRANLIVMSGDTRDASVARLKLPSGVRIQLGKSLHATFTCRVAEPQNPSYARALAALCVFLNADLAATDLGRLFRAPGVVAGEWGTQSPSSFRSGDQVRIQTVLRAERNAVGLDELADKVEAACKSEGYDVGEGLDALTSAAAMRSAASELDVGDGAALREAAARITANRCLDDEARRLLREANVALGGSLTSRSRSGVAGLIGGYGHARLPRETPVRTVMPTGVVKALPFADWAAELPELRLSSRPDGSPAGLSAWAPTAAGERHREGDRAGSPRVKPAGTIWIDNDDCVHLACHVERVVYSPSRPLDPAAACPPIPAAGSSPFLKLAPFAPGSAIVLRSDTGTGKTHALCTAVSKSCALIVTPRISIAGEAARRYNATDYRHHDGVLRLRGSGGIRRGTATRGSERIAVCVNSLGRVELPDPGQPFSLVVEESEQVAMALFGGTIPLLPDERGVSSKTVLDGLISAARAAKASGGSVIVVDATAGNLTDCLLRVMLGSAADKAITVGIGRRRDITVRPWLVEEHGGAGGDGARANMRAAIAREVSAGRRVAYACLTADAAHEVAAILASCDRPDGRRCRVRLYVGDDNAKLDAEVRRPLSDLDNVNCEWGPEACDVVVYSPVVSAAVSYDRADDWERFDMAVLEAPTVPHASWALGVQMLDRARHVSAVWFNAPYRQQPAAVRELSACRRQLRQRWLADVAAVAAARGLEVSPHNPADNGLAELCGTREYVVGLRGSDVAQDILAYFVDRGATVLRDHQSDPADDAWISAAARRARKMREEQWVGLVCEAEQFEDDAEFVFERDDRQRLPLGAERDGVLARLNAHRHRVRYGDRYVVPELVLADRNGALFTSVLELVRAGLIADGETRRAARRAIDIVGAGSEAGSTGAVQRSVAAILLLRLLLGDRWTSALLAPLRGVVPASDGFGTGAPLLKAPLRQMAGVAAGRVPKVLRDTTWSAVELEGQASQLESAFNDALAAHGVDAAVLRSSGFAPKDVGRRPGVAIGRALQLLGFKTRREREGGGARKSRYRLDTSRWQDRTTLAERLNRRSRGLAVASVFAPRSRGPPS